MWEMSSEYKLYIYIHTHTLVNILSSLSLICLPNSLDLDKYGQFSEDKD